MTVIAVYRRTPDSPFADTGMDAWAAHGPGTDIIGGFDPHLAQYWQGDGIRKTWSDAAAQDICTDRSIERLWHTAEGRWVISTGGSGPRHYLTEAEADAWLTENGYATEADREAWVQTLNARR